MVSNADKIASIVTVGNESCITKVITKLNDCRLDELAHVLDFISCNMCFVGTRSEISIRYKDEAELLDGASVM